MSFATLRRFCFFLLVFGLTVSSLSATCMMYPVQLDERVMASEHIVLGRLVDQHSYWDARHQKIYTLNRIQVTAWIKGARPDLTVGVITEGGVVGNQAMISHPSLTVDPYNEYVFFLQGDDAIADDKDLRQREPGLIQSLPYADAQGAIVKQSGWFHDLYAEPVQSEAALLSQISDLCGQVAVGPGGQAFTAREGDTFPLSSWAPGLYERRPPVTSIAPNPTHSGTIDPADFITINGSGFGGTAGTIFYTNADDGGATFTASGVATDNISWNDAQIQNKPARRGGTGPVSVNGTITSPFDLTIDYAHIEINSSFAGFGSTTRQRFLLVDKNGAGGYTFQENTAFAANAAASAAFGRALETWRCATLVNFEVNGTTAVAAVGNDGTNVVFFNAALPAGVLGRATSFFQASATGACNTTNTVWWTDGLDVEFRPDPPAGCCTWNFGPTASGFLEFDFESVALHELGHAHGMGHVINPGAVMHFSISNGTDSRVLSTNDIDAGNAKMAYSTLPLCFNPAGVNGPMQALPPGICLLPVTWSSFSGLHVPERGNLLQWEVSQELHSLGYSVERSTDGQHFEPIGFVSSQTARQDGPLNYDFLDQDAGNTTRHYYRLEQQDLNGSRSYSEVISIEGFSTAQVVAYPTLVRDQLHFEVTATSAGDMEILLFTAGGQRVGNLTQRIEAGVSVHDMDCSRLAEGIYFYQVRLGEHRFSGKFLR